MHGRTFSNPNYTVVSICVTGEQERSARSYCAEHASRGVEFDGLGMYMARMPKIFRDVIDVFRDTRKRKDSTFCSKYVTGVMQHIGIKSFMCMDPAGTSPSLLHRCITGTGGSSSSHHHSLTTAAVDAMDIEESGVSSGGGGVMAPPPYRTGLLESKGVLW